MKKRILSAVLPLFFFLTMIFSAPPYSAAADDSALQADGYACLLTDDAFFYGSRDEKQGLFLLPKSYYVKILEYDDEFCKIEYLYDDEYVQKLTGYAKTSDLTAVSYVPKRPYLYKLMEVRYTLDGVAAGDDFLDTITVTCAYYGDYRIGSKTYCYILRGDSFGYVPKPDNFTIEENTEYAEWLLENATPDTPASGGEPSSGETSPAQIAILIALCLLVPVLAALILRPSKSHPLDLD